MTEIERLILSRNRPNVWQVAAQGIGRVVDAARRGQLEREQRTDQLRQRDLERNEAIIRLTQAPGFSLDDGRQPVAPVEPGEPASKFPGVGRAVLGRQQPTPSAPAGTPAAVPGMPMPPSQSASAPAAGGSPPEFRSPGALTEALHRARDTSARTFLPESSRRLIASLNYGGTEPPLKVYFDPSQTSAAGKERDAAAAAQRNREAFEMLKRLDPDTFSDEYFTPDVDWTEEVKRVLPGRGRTASLRGAGWSESEAHTEGYHNVNLREDRRSQASAGRAAENQAEQQITRQLNDAAGLARTMAANGGTAQHIYANLSKMPKYKGLPQGRLLQTIQQSLDDAAIAKNRGTTREQPVDPRQRELEQGANQLLGRPPADEFERRIRDQVTRGVSSDSILAGIRRGAQARGLSEDEIKSWVSRAQSYLLNAGIR